MLEDIITLMRFRFIFDCIVSQATYIKYEKITKM